MTVIMANAVDIRGTDTFLAGGNTMIRRSLQTQEVFFQWSHTGVNQQKALVVLWNKRCAWHTGMTFALEEG